MEGAADEEALGDGRVAPFDGMVSMAERVGVERWRVLALLWREAYAGWLLLDQGPIGCVFAS